MFAPHTYYWTRLFEIILIGGAPTLMGFTAIGNKLLYSGQRYRFLAEKRTLALPPGEEDGDRPPGDEDG